MIGMKVVAKRNGKLLILAPEGRVGAFAAKELQDTIEQQLAPGIVTVVFDPFKVTLSQNNHNLFAVLTHE